MTAMAKTRMRDQGPYDLLSILVNKTDMALSNDAFIDRRSAKVGTRNRQPPARGMGLARTPRLRRPERLCYPRNRCVDAGAVRVRLVLSEPGSVQAGDRGPQNSPEEQPMVTRPEAGWRPIERRRVDRHGTFAWGCSSAGRAPAWHAGGRGFESPQLHQSPAFAGMPVKLRWYREAPLRPGRRRGSLLGWEIRG